ncbi:MAG: hypothetical protein ACRDD7_14720, partial [Peptostreptococcaceae bacterium]
ANGIVAEEIIGKILIGSKVIITTELGDFIIGNVENDSKKGFGLQIKEGDTQRVFLGTELDGNGVRRAIFRLVSKDGQKVVVSDEGILQTNQNGDERELDPQHPLTIDWYVSEGTSRIDVAKLLVKCKRFRSTTRGGRFISQISTVPSGGGSTSGGGGGGTSASGGNHTHKMFDDLGADVAYPIVDTTLACAGNGSYIFAKVGQPAGRGTYVTAGSSGNHTHNTDYHYHSTPNHIHAGIDISHQHEEVYGIQESTLATNLIITVNGTLVANGINGIAEIDIAQYLKIGQWNEVQIQSFSNGAVSWAIFTKTFDRF